MSLHVAVRLTGQAAIDAQTLFQDNQNRHNAAPIPVTGRNLADIQNDFFKRAEHILQEWQATAPQAVRNLQLDRTATHVRRYGNDENALYHATALYPSIFLDDRTDKPTFYGFYPRDYQGHAVTPDDCELLSDAEEQRIGERLFAGGWSTPPALISLPEHGIALPEDFDANAPNILTSNIQDNAKIYAVAHNDPSYLSYALAHDFWKSNSETLSSKIREHAQKLIDSGIITGAAPQQIHPQMMTSYPHGNKKLNIELSFTHSGFGHLSHPGQFDCFDLVFTNNRPAVLFHERTEEAKELKQLAENITAEPKLGDFIEGAGTMYLRKLGEHVFAYQPDGNNPTMDKLGYRQVPLALYLWLGMETERANNYEKLPPRSEAFYTMYRNYLGESAAIAAQPAAPAPI